MAFIIKKMQKYPSEQKQLNFGKHKSRYNLKTKIRNKTKKKFK